MEDRPPDQSTQSGLGTGLDSGLDSELDVMERDLADVEVALVRLDAGTYWTCEVTGTPLPDDLLAEHPAARRVTA
jgi:RNA polymerase-binding transcription factor DksA